MLKQLPIDDIFTGSNELDHLTTISETAHPNNSNKSNRTYNTKNTTGLDLSIDAIYILIQLICSCLAGVYNEYLLKGDGARVNIYVQNFFMYLDSIVCNLVFLILQGNLMGAFNMANLGSVFTLNVILIIFNNAAIGIVTSFFLRYLNSILKTFASALELLFTAILCYIFFNIPIHLNTVLSIGVVSFSIYLYSLSPVININNRNFNKKKSACVNKHENFQLLEEDTEMV